jgi:hypothetical protein
LQEYIFEVNASQVFQKEINQQRKWFLDTQGEGDGTIEHQVWRAQRIGVSSGLNGVRLKNQM